MLANDLKLTQHLITLPAQMRSQITPFYRVKRRQMYAWWAVVLPGYQPRLNWLTVVTRSWW